MKPITIKLFGIFNLVLLLSISAHSIPNPKSQDKPKLGFYKSAFGFEIKNDGTDWIQTDPPKKSRFVETVYRSPIIRNNVQASFTIRVDNMKNRIDLKNYVKKWAKEYPKYGYDVLGSQPFRDGKDWGYVIDLINPSKNRQLRQIIRMNGNVAVLMTCRDHSATFNNSLKECNKIAKNFKWKNSKKTSVN